jgi:pentatricopeptide repeat protein
MENIRLRTYQPILSLYLEQGDMASALSLFKRMRDIPSVISEPETYVQVIAALAEKGYFHPTKAEPIDGALELGFNPPCGPGLMNQLVTALAEDVIQVTPALAKRLHTAMTKAFKNDDRGRNLEALHPLAPLLPDNTKEEAGDIEEVIACRVEIDTTTGICPKTGARLRLINLVGPERQKLKDGLLDLSEKEHARFTKNWKKRDNGRPPMVPREQLEKFSTFLECVLR